ncbi:macro domain-containing protein [uncultured Salinicola sp.]|uniref:macro domain-containing protein n=1 Tax=uncultured Salinicola sp. TaxID=1193542 RepID=UPI00260211FA|nr:macro domain-containing protein [uncultured Salinicola sp.]
MDLTQGFPMAFKKQPLETLEYTSGNIVEHDAEVLVNTVNCRLKRNGEGVMGAGVAKAFKEKWGAAVMRPYEAAIRSGELRPGRAILFDLPDGRKWAALATKDDWQSDSRMEWVESGLRELGNKLREGGYKSVAITPPGCGNGGLDWKKVEPLVHEALKGVDVAMFAKPSGAMVSRDTGMDGPAPDNPSVLAKKRDGEIRKNLLGKIVDKPDVSFDTAFSAGRSKVVVAMSVQEEPGGRAIPVHFKSDEMENRDAHRAVADLNRLKKGADVTLGGRWARGRSGAWGFVAARMAEGRIPVSGLLSRSPSPRVMVDPHFADLTAADPDLELKAAAERARDPLRQKEEDERTFKGEPIAEKGSMYFAFGWEARPDVKSQTTFDAILDGERTSTTRFDKWKNSDRWGKLKRGDLVRFYEDREMEGKSVVVRVDSVERIDMRTLTDEGREKWSKAEGWSTLHAKKSAERYGAGFQIRYHPVPGQEILKGRGAERLAESMEKAARDSDQKRDLDALTGGRHSRMQRPGMMAALGQGLGR